MDKETLEVLHNFSQTNQQIMIYEGNTLATISVSGNVFATAKVPTHFPKDFGIFNLNEFLSVMKMFSEPEIEYGDTSMTIKEGKMKVRYGYCSPAAIKSPPKGKSINKGEELIVHRVTVSDMEQLMKAASILKADTFLINNKGVKVFNHSSMANDFALELECLSSNSDDDYIIGVDAIKLIRGEYVMTVCERVVHFDNEDRDVSYAIAQRME